MRGHTKGVAGQLLKTAIEPFAADPMTSAVLLDIDGTLAPIVEHPENATVPEATRQLLIPMSRQYGLLACVSGRRASDARAMVAVGSMYYLGSHGAEVLNAGATEAVLDPRLAEWSQRVEQFSRDLDTVNLQHRRVRVEDKGSMLALHWRGAADEESARAVVDTIAEQARAAGFETHWGRKVMEIWPPVPVNKGTGITTLLDGRGVTRALFAGDDITDLDAFHALKDLVAAGKLESAVCVGVASDEGPAEIVSEADVVVDGPDGIREMLVGLRLDADE